MEADLFYQFFVNVGHDVSIAVETTSIKSQLSFIYL